MPDQTLSPNSNRINSMLQDLATQRAGAPQNLPTGQAGLPTPSAQSPAPVPSPAPMPRPVLPPQPSPIARPNDTVGQAPARQSPPIPQAPKPVVPVPPTPKPQPPAPSAPSPKPSYTSEMRTMSADIGNIKVGQAPAGIKPTPPSPKASEGQAPIPAPSAIVIPSSSSGGGAKKLIYGVLVVALVGIVIYGIASLMGGNGEQQATASPSPSASATPVGKMLSSYFGVSQSTINLTKATGTENLADFQSKLNAMQITAQQASVLALQHAGIASSFSTFMSDIGNTLPQDLDSAITNDWTALSYGQSQQSARLILVAEINNASQANQALQIWESSGMASANSKLFKYDVTKQAAAFANGTYRQISLRAAAIFGLRRWGLS